MDCDFNTIIKKLENLHINYADKDEDKKEPDIQKYKKSVIEVPIREEKCEVKLLRSKMFLMQEATKDKWLKMNKDLNELKGIVKDKDKTIAELNELECIVKEKDKTIAELKDLECIVKRKDKTIVELEGVVKEKDEAIVELEGIVKEKDKTIAELNELEGIVKEKDETIAELNKTIHELKMNAQSQERNDSKVIIY